MGRVFLLVYDLYEIHVVINDEFWILGVLV